MSDASQYLLVVYQLTRTGGRVVSPGRVAAELGRSPSATTEMLQRLDARGLVDYRPYEGAKLTDEGRETAAELHDSYLVLRRFFRDVLELADPDAEALELAGAVSPLVTDRLASTVFSDAPAGCRSAAAVSEDRSDD